MPGQKPPLPPLFLVDDGVVRGWHVRDGGTRNVMARNPVHPGSGRFDAVAVWYEIVAGARDRLPKGGFGGG